MPVRQKPPAPFIRTGALLASTAAAGFGVVLASGVSQAVTTTPAHDLAEVRPVQLWETHQWHLDHMTHLARTGGVSSAPTAVADSGGKTWGVTYGYPNYCGDGDGDGWDVDCSTRHQASNPAAPARVVSAGSSSVAAAPGSFQACVIARESGGNPRAVNASSGAGGLYQFLPSTWAGLGYSGLPENASVATQTQAFNKLYAQAGTQPWSPSDHC